MQHAALAVVVAVVVVVLGQTFLWGYRNAPLHREMRARAVTFRTELDRVRIPDGTP